MPDKMKYMRKQAGVHVQHVGRVRAGLHTEVCWGLTSGFPLTYSATAWVTPLHILSSLQARSMLKGWQSGYFKGMLRGLGSAYSRTSEIWRWAGWPSSCLTGGSIQSPLQQHLVSQNVAAQGAVLLKDKLAQAIKATCALLEVNVSYSDKMPNVKLHLHQCKTFST